jgi:RimJ/RimL family protein N-acetyltransferase
MIELRPLHDTDIAIFQAWLHAPHVAPWFSDPESWLHEVRQREGEFRFIRHFIAWSDNQPLGFCQYYCCGDSGEPEYAAFPPATTYSIDYLIGEAARLGRGYAKAMLAELIARIRRETPAERIVVQPDDQNQASKALLKSLGFTYDSDLAVFRLALERQDPF